MTSDGARHGAPLWLVFQRLDLIGLELPRSGRCAGVADDDDDRAAGPRRPRGREADLAGPG
jgi:hypothetical protein